MGRIGIRPVEVRKVRKVRSSRSKVGVGLGPPSCGSVPKTGSRLMLGAGDGDREHQTLPLGLGVAVQQQARI